MRSRRQRTILLGLLLLVLVSPGRGEEVSPKRQPIARFVLQWGTKGSKPGEFNFPIGLAINRADEILVADHYNNRVQKFDSHGKLLAVFPVLQHPGGIAVDDSGKIYLSHFAESRPPYEKTPDRMSIYDAQGKLVRQWGKSGKGDSEFDFPGGIAVASDGRIYLADQTNRRVQVFDRHGEFLFKWGAYGTQPGQFGGNVTPRSRVGGPQFVAIDGDGNVYTTEGSVGRVQKFTAEGKFVLAWGTNKDQPGSFGGAFSGFKTGLQGPIAICVDRHNDVWVSAVSGRIQRFSVDGKFRGGFGEQGKGAGQFLAPHGIGFDSHNNLYVVDAFNHRIQSFGIID